jgi:hypothetical protein
MQKKGRGLGITVNELLDSVRLRLAVDAYNAGDKSFLKAILTELGLEVFLATKSSLTKVVGKITGPGWVNPTTGERMGAGLNQGESVAYLRSLQIDDILNNMNVWWGLSPVEVELYRGDIKGTLPPEKKKELLDRVKKKFDLK